MKHLEMIEGWFLFLFLFYEPARNIYIQRPCSFAEALGLMTATLVQCSGVV